MSPKGTGLRLTAHFLKRKAVVPLFGNQDNFFFFLNNSQHHHPKQDSQKVVHLILDWMGILDFALYAECSIGSIGLAHGGSGGIERFFSPVFFLTFYLPIWTLLLAFGWLFMKKFFGNLRNQSTQKHLLPDTITVFNKDASKRKD